MDLAKAKALLDRLDGGGGFALYSGQFLDEHAPGLITIAESWSTGVGRTRAQAHRLSFVLVEAYQNIIRHRARLSGRMGRSLLLLRVTRDADLVLSLDPVHSSEQALVEQALREIGASDLVQLKQRFLARLRDGTRTLRGGAGLGLIEMARRSGGALQHDWLALNEDHRLLLLQAVMGGADGHALPPATADELQALAADLGVVLAHARGVSPAADAAMLRIMEREVPESETLLRVFHAASEWLGAESGALVQALLLCATEAGQGLIIAVKGPRASMELLSQRVRQAAALGNAELAAMQRHALLGRPAAEGMSAAFIELVRASGAALSIDVLGGESQAWLLWRIPLGG